jgi:hypothetical protein
LEWLYSVGAKKKGKINIVEVFSFYILHLKLKKMNYQSVKKNWQICGLKRKKSWVQRNQKKKAPHSHKVKYLTKKHC